MNLIAQSTSTFWLPAAAVLCAVTALVVILALPWWLRRRRREDTGTMPTLQVNVSALPAAGPPDAGPKVRLYNVPVRVAVIVLAPVGRGAPQPAASQVTGIIDQIVPGLGDATTAHGCSVKVWPAQLSSQGFMHQFSVNVGLPGDGGKGTPWCSMCGRFDADGTQYLAGLLLCAAKANSLGHFLVERPSQWCDMLRVDTDAVGK